MGLNILVAGGAGFIGSSLVRNLVSHGHRVTVVDNFLAGARSNLSEVAALVNIVECDASIAEDIRAVIMKVQPTHVVSCIGDTYIPAAYHAPARFFRNNLDAHLNLLQACRQPGIVKFLYLSTAEVYGSQSIALDEESTLGAANTYAVSKLAADRLMETFALEHGVPTLIARMFNCYGPRETHAYIVPELIDQFHRSADVSIGDIRPVRDLTFVDDSAEALRLLLTASTSAGDVVNVGSGVGIDIGTLAERIGRLMGHETPVVHSDEARFRRNEIDVIRCDNGKLRALTGWTPQVPLDEGLRRTIGWFADHGARWPWQSHDEESGRHSEIAHLHRA